MPSLAWVRFFAILLTLFAVGCDGTISVTFFTGPQEFDVSSTDFALPTVLRDGSGNIALVPCGATGVCAPSDVVPLTCEAGNCDPAPVTLDGPVGSVIDIDALLSTSSTVGIRRIESYDVEEVGFAVRLNTLTIDLGPIEVFWGPEAASAIDPALGVRPFGTIPPIAARSTFDGQVALDDVGVRELSAYLVYTGTRIRFFARSTIDLEPGDPFPEGTLHVEVNATITAVGRVID